ncbi:hypothetical protein A2159_01695, partial [Candidatus Woesebacteria bacterium RBG_13_34_9]
VFLFGLIIGSFLSAFTYRNPRKFYINKGRSFCDKCKKQIIWYDNIPLLSYLLLQGRCRNCRKNISLRYPLIEFTTSLIFLSIYYFYENCSFLALDNLYSKLSFCGIREILGIWSLPIGFLIAFLLIAIFIIDFENQIIPDNLVFFLSVIALILLILTSNNGFFTTVFSAFVSSLFFLFLFLITKGKGMGAGDIKLVLALSLFLNWHYILLYIFLSFSLGAIIGIILIIFHKARFGKHIPFAPYIILSFLMTYLFGDKLMMVLFPLLN